MTAQHPRGYVITEHQLRQIELDDYPEIVCEQVRTRPHTPAPEHKWTEAEVVNEVSMAFDRGVAVGEQAARTATLAACDFIEMISYTDKCPDGVECTTKLKCYECAIESLRTAAQEVRR